MRLLSIIGSNIFNGPHNHDLRLNGALAEAGIETIVLLPDEQGDASERLCGKGIKVLTYPSNRTLGAASGYGSRLGIPGFLKTGATCHSMATPESLARSCRGAAA